MMMAGPRCFTMMEGSRRVALDVVLDLSEVVLMTEVGVGQRVRGAGGEGGGEAGRGAGL